MTGARAYDAIVIGAGANGLVAAAALGRAGLSVLVLERHEGVGGIGRVEEFAPGFRAAPFALDCGWLPPVVARGLGLVGGAGLERARSDAALTVAVAPGEFLALSPDVARATEAIRRHSERDAGRWPAFTARLARLAGFLEALYQTPPPDVDASGPRDVLPLLGLALRLRALGREEMTEFLRVMPMSAQDLLEEWFESEPLRAAVAAGGVEEIRQGPRSGGTAFALLHHLVGAPAGTVRGRGWWRAGPDAFTAAVEATARRHGATIRAGAPVARILVRDDAVAGVALASGEEITAPRVVSTADPARTFLGLVDPVWLDPEFLHAVRQIKFRGCAAVVLYALDVLPDIAGPSGIAAGRGRGGGEGSAPAADHPLAGIVSLTPTVAALERAADAAKYGRVSERPHVEITAPTLRWPALAPDGKHVLVARAQYAPYRLRDDVGWDAARRGALADAVTAAIEAAAPGFASRLLHRATLTPRDIEERYDLTEGAATHGEITLDQILFMRPLAGWGRYATPIDGLYLGGAGAHPGPGVLGGAGWLAARRLLGDRRRR
jgi:phytoene dehydrogenase-like protein